jgi:hypothetical protein
MRPSQIHSFCLALAATLAWSVPAAAHERPATTPAARFVQATIDTAFALARPPMTLDENRRLESVIERSMDWSGLTQFAVGRYRADLEAAAMDAVKARLADRLGALARTAGRELGTLVLVVRDMRVDAEGNRHVTSTAILQRFGEVEVAWTLVPVQDGGYRIVDIAALGLTLRHFLRGWVTSLIADRGGDPGAVFGPPGNTSPH